MTMPGRRSRDNSPYLADARRLASDIAGARKKKKFTQEEVARMAGLSLSTVRKIEGSMVTEPGFFPILAIMTVLDMDPTKLRLPVVSRTRGELQRRQP